VDWNSVPSSGRGVGRLTPLRRSEGKGACKSDGFTLVEVIVVLVILAILAAIAIPALTGYIDKANTSQIKAKARSAAVAMQTILSEAYADPQTRVSSGGALYLGGKQIAALYKPENYKEVQADITGAPEGTYAVLNHDQYYQDFLDVLLKLDPAAEYDNAMFGSESVFLPAITHALVDEHLGILAYIYVDPESRNEPRVCTYNYDDLSIENGQSVKYDHSAGFKVWSVDFPAGKVTLIG
jgi:prepilin-type N-terminal cleavage/methylation domain-containing protein